MTHEFLPPPRVRLCRRHFLGAVLVATAGGCASLAGPLSETTPQPPAESPPTIRLSYRTDTGRLNQLALGGHEGRQVAYAPPADTPLPPFTTSTLTIDYPHPSGAAGMAQVTVAFAPTTQNDNGWLHSAIIGREDPPAAASPQFHEIWRADIHQWQLVSLLSQLEEKQFFRRVRVLGSEATIETQINNKQFKKEFPPLAELDSLILHIRRHGHLVSSSQPPGPIRRLPPPADWPTG